jgi:hypothetical protein
VSLRWAAAIDRHYRASLVPSGLIGNATDAGQILSTRASAVVPLTTTVLTVTLVGDQLREELEKRYPVATFEHPDDQ